MATERRPYRDSQDARMKAKGYVTVAKAAEMTNTALTTLYRWIGDRKVTGKRVGSARYVSLKSLKKYLGPIMGDDIELPDSPESLE